MRFPWERDLVRTCAKCGESWTVPYLLRRQKPSTRPRGGLLGLMTSQSPARRRLDPWSRGTAALRPAMTRGASADEERELIASLARCSACLSTEYVDTPVPRKPKPSTG